MNRWSTEMNESLSQDPPVIRLLLALLDEAYDHESWHGPNLRGSVRGVNAGLAAWRPVPNGNRFHTQAGQYSDSPVSLSRTGSDRS